MSRGGRSRGRDRLRRPTEVLPEQHYRVGLVVVGLVLVAAGLLLSLPGLSPSVPRFDDAQIRAPMINVYSASPLEHLYVLADATTPDIMLKIFPGDPAGGATPQPLEDGEALDVVVTVHSFEEFEWELAEGLERADTDREDILSDRQGGASRREVFVGTLSPEHPVLGARIRSSHPVVDRSGPYVRVSLPEVGSEPGDPQSTRDLSTAIVPVEDQIEDAAYYGTFRGTDYWVAAVTIEVVGAPYEATYPDWVIHRRSPDVVR